MPAPPHALSPNDTLKTLHSSLRGLDAKQHRAALRRYGPNRLPRTHPRPVWAIFGHQFRGVVTWLLMVATALAFLSGDHAEALAVLVVILLNAMIGFIAELHAVRSMEALARLTDHPAQVRRDGRVTMVDTSSLVPGDVVVIHAGDMVGADMRLLAASGLQCDESVLTGESLPVDKGPDVLPADTPLADRANMLHGGGRVTRGTAEAVVTATGHAMELGRISAMVAGAAPRLSPLEVRLDKLGARLVWLMLGLAAAMVAAGLMRGHTPADILPTGVALAVAAVPEGLPVVATLSLARGLRRMLARNVLVRRLSAVETLGSVSLILTDKTGTLTENRMRAVQILTPHGEVTPKADGALPADDPELPHLQEILAGLAEERDPIDAALALLAGGVEQSPPKVIRTHAFDPARRMAAQVMTTDEGWRIVVRGAPEAVLQAATHVSGSSGPEPLTEAVRQDWGDWMMRQAGQGRRCIALAERRADRPDLPPFVALVLVAFAALADPLRSGVPAALAACRRAGVRVVMVTGDHAATAASIAAQAGIGGAVPVVTEGADLTDFPETLPARMQETDVFARVLPEDKMRLIRLFQAQGAVVAMTGDGVNDAPALAQADIGIAMGQRGTQVAREAADMVLRDDSLDAIVAAMREGRIILDNIRAFILYLMCCNLSEVLLVGGAVILGLPTPLLPLQILFLNLVTDVFPAFALGLGLGRADVLERTPSPRGTPLLSRGDWLRIGWLGSGITLSCLAAFWLALNWLHLPLGEAISVTFLVLALAQVWTVVSVRPAGTRIWTAPALNNPYVYFAVPLCLGLIAAALLVPFLSSVLNLPNPGWAGIGLGFGASLVPPLLPVPGTSYVSEPSRPTRDPSA